MKTTRTVDIMKVLGINREEYFIFLGKTFLATLDGGKHRFPKHISEKVAVIDKDLFQRLISEVKVGDEIEATTVTSWPSLDTHLEGFLRVNNA